MRKAAPNATPAATVSAKGLTSSLSESKITAMGETLSYTQEVANAAGRFYSSLNSLQTCELFSNFPERAAEAGINLGDDSWMGYHAGAKRKHRLAEFSARTLFSESEIDLHALSQLAYEISGDYPLMLPQIVDDWKKFKNDEDITLDARVRMRRLVQLGIGDTEMQFLVIGSSRNS